MNKIVLVGVVLLLLFAVGCDTELGHSDEGHDHDGDGIEDHAAEDHGDEEDGHDEEREGYS